MKRIDRIDLSVGRHGLLPALLTVLFVGLKLTGHITWSWLWVLSPIWISLLVGLAVLAVVLAVLFFVSR